MRVGVVGINHKLADLQLREMLAKACQKQFHPSNLFHGKHAFCLLSTCNRTEVYFSSEDLADTHSYLLNVLRSEVRVPFEHKLYSYFGYDCLSQAVRVTAGLDSAIIGETEIHVRFHRRAHLPIVIASGLLDDPIEVPWWQGRRLRLSA